MRGTPVLVDVTVSSSGVVIAGIGMVGASAASWTLSGLLCDTGALVLVRRTNHRGCAPLSRSPSPNVTISGSRESSLSACSTPTPLGERRPQRGADCRGKHALVSAYDHPVELLRKLRRALVGLPYQEEEPPTPATARPVHESAKNFSRSCSVIESLLKDTTMSPRVRATLVILAPANIHTSR